MEYYLSVKTRPYTKKEKGTYLISASKYSIETNQIFCWENKVNSKKIVIEEDVFKKQDDNKRKYLPIIFPRPNVSFAKNFVVWAKDEDGLAGNIKIKIINERKYLGFFESYPYDLWRMTMEFKKWKE